MFHCRRSRLAVIALACLAFAAPARAADAEKSFPLRDGDTWVMAGDSITAQHLHSNYFEAYCFTRFPQWKFAFRNSGVGGDTVPKVLARFDRDVAVWKPTVVSVELAMNDVGAHDAKAFVSQMGTLIERIEAIKARPVMLSSSPVNDGSTLARMAERNKWLDEYINAQKAAFAGKYPFADQFHALIDRWGRNKTAGEPQRLARELKAATANKSLPNPELLQPWLDAFDRSDLAKLQAVDLTGDAVHPGAVGQVTMAAALLRELGAPGLVSAAEITLAGAEAKVDKADRCEIADLKAENGGVSFTRLDACLPMPIPAQAYGALAVMPEIADLSRWTLAVRGLKPGKYAVSIDGVEVGQYSDEALAKGCNLGALEKGPAAEQGQKVLAAVAAKEALVGSFRKAHAAVAASNPADAAKSSDPLLKEILAADDAIRAAAQPRKLAFVVAPVK